MESLHTHPPHFYGTMNRNETLGLLSLPGKLKWNSPSSDLIKQVNVFLWSVKEGQECVMEVKLKIFEKYTNVEAVQTHVPNFILSCNVSKSCLSCSIVVL